MTTLPELAPALAALLAASLYGSLLALLLLALQPLLRRQMPARWRFALWLVVFIRFIPFPLPASPLSAGNWFADTSSPLAPKPVPDASASSFVAPPLPPPITSVARPAVASNSDAVRINESASGPESVTLAPIPAIVESPASPLILAVPAHTPSLTLATLFSFIYLLGGAVVLARPLFATLALRGIVRRATVVTDSAMLALLQSVCRPLGIHRSLPLLTTDALKSPALVGLFRPRLLLPRDLPALLSTDELRLVFLHEAAHVRRHDVLANYALSLLHILHWFNPLVWLLLPRVRAERELACDEAVLRHTSDPAPYGHTLLKLFEFAQPARSIAPAVGIVESRTFMARRIRMIADYGPRPAWLTFPILAIIVTGFLLTGPASRGQTSSFEALPGEMPLSYSSPEVDKTPAGNVTFHGPFNLDTLYISSAKLPAHDFLDISLDLLVLRSWDGSVPITNEKQKPIDIGPDFFRLGLRDGPTLLYTTFSNTPDNPPGFRWESKTQNYPSQVPGDLFLPWSGAATKNTLGYNYPNAGPPQLVPMDATYHIHFIVPHHGGGVTLEMTGINLQDMHDESWGVANVSISPLTSDKVIHPAAGTIAAAFNASLDPQTADLPAQFQQLISGLDDTVSWIQQNVPPMPIDAGKVASLISDLKSGDEMIAERVASHIGLLSMGHAVEPALRDARRTVAGEQRLRIDWVLSVLDVRPPSDNAAVLDWLMAPEGQGIPSEGMRRVALATRVLEIIGTPRAMALRNKLTLATAAELSAAPRPLRVAHPGALAGDHFATKVQELLGISDTGADVLPQFSDAVTVALAAGADGEIPGVLLLAGGSAPLSKPATTRGSGPLPPTPTERALDQLAAALLKGPHATAFVEKYLDWVEIGPKHGSVAHNPVFDTEQHFDRLTADLLGRARQVAASDPKKASDLARAALMLAAMSDYYLGWYNVSFVENEPVEARRLLALPGDRFDQLAQLIRSRPTFGSSSGGMATGLVIDKVTKAKNTPVDLALVTKITAGIDKDFRQGMPQIGYRFEKIHLAWQFLNLMKQRKSAEGEAAMRVLLETWKKDFPDPDISRWIDQALTRNGPVPGHQVGFYVNGKALDADEYEAYEQEMEKKNATQPASGGKSAVPGEPPLSAPSSRPQDSK